MGAAVSALRFGGRLLNLAKEWLDLKEAWRRSKIPASKNGKPTKAEKQAALITSWRQMVIDVRRAVDRNDVTVDYALHQHQAFPSIRPYLSEDTKDAISKLRAEQSLEGTMDDIDRKEQEWGLRY